MLRIFISVLLCLTYSTTLAAEDEFTDIQRVERMVRMNSNGLISISYDVKWPWDKAKYGHSLYKILKTDMLQLDAECREVKKSMMDDSKVMLSPKLHNATKSLFNNGEVHHILLLNSVMKKYAGFHPVDSETADDKGNYKPIVTALCTNDDVDNFGMIQHMFPTFEGTFDAEVKIGTCTRFQKAATCLRDIFTISESRLNSATKVVEFKSPGILQNAWLVP